MKRKTVTGVGANNPRYMEIAETIARDIERGRLKVGSFLLPESELGANFNVSRGTIRQSLSILEDAGLIVRRQRSGTSILSKFPVRGLIDHDQIHDDWTRYGTQYPLRISAVERKTPPPELTRGERSIPRRPWLAVTGLRYPPSSRTPVSYCEAFVHPDFSDISRDISFLPTPLFALLEQRYGRVIERVRVELRSVTITPEIAKELGRVPGSPALQLIRFFIDAKRRSIEIAVNTHPADCFTYQIEIVRSPHR